MSLPEERYGQKGRAYFVISNGKRQEPDPISWFISDYFNLGSFVNSKEALCPKDEVRFLIMWTTQNGLYSVKRSGDLIRA